MPHPNNTSIAKMTCSADEPTKNAQCLTRKVSFIFYCAPRDDGNRNPIYTSVYGKTTFRVGVTDSASYLTDLPYIVIDADTKKVIFPSEASKAKNAKFASRKDTNTLHDGVRHMHTLDPINIPDGVKRIALHIGNDVFPKNRKLQLFPLNVPDTAHSKVHIYEIRTDLQEKFTADNKLGSPPTQNTLAAKPEASDEYFGYLNGDLWLSISHEFTSDEISQLCPSETLSRTAPENPHSGVHKNSGTTQTVAVDWSAVLQSIYNAGENSRSLDAFTVQVPTLDIKLNFPARAFANAINTSARTTVQQALRRTSPRAFAAILKAAWRLNIDTICLSSSWRPMLGSRLHKMGNGLDVTEFSDSAENINFLIRNRGVIDHKAPFPTTASGDKMSRLYAELNSDQQIATGKVFTPWINWVEPHDTHMHITVKND